MAGWIKSKVITTNVAAEENGSMRATRTMCGFFFLTQMRTLVTKCSSSSSILGP